MFETLDFHWDILQKRLREFAFLTRGLSITLRDERRSVREKTYQYEGGIVKLVEHLNDKKIRCTRSSPPTGSAKAST